jgi:hypothetical protein
VNPILKKLLAGLFLFAGCFQALCAPANDNFDSRIELTGTNITVSGDNTDASSESGEATGGGAIYYYYSVWYEWTAPAEGMLYISGTPLFPGATMGVDYYRGTNVSSLTSVATTSDGGIAVTGGDKIVIRVTSLLYYYDNVGGVTGPFALSLSFMPPAMASSNDLFANRITMSPSAFHFTGSIYGATSETGEPLPSGTTQTLWFSFTPTEEGILKCVATSGHFAPTLTVYDGDDFSTMVPVTSTGNSLYTVHAGHSYSIQVASAAVPGGVFSLNAAFFPKRDDTFATCDQLTGTNVIYSGSDVFATLESGEPATGGTNTVWMAWVAPGNGYVELAGDPATPDGQYYAVYTGATVNNLQAVPLVSVGVGSLYRFPVATGTVYHFQFSGSAPSFTLNFVFHPGSRCVNDNFADALLVKDVTATFQPVPIDDATAELGEPLHLGSVPQKSVWWKWQAPNWGTVKVSVPANAISNLVFAVYSGSSLETLNLVGKAANTNMVSFTAVGGETYYFAAAAPTNAVGDVLPHQGYQAIDTSVHSVFGNLVQEPSWEGTGLDGALHWTSKGPLEGFVNEAHRGDVDGVTWPVLPHHTIISQDIPTVPGHSYAVRFAFWFGDQLTYQAGERQVSFWWGTNLVGVSTNLEGFPHWGNYIVFASNTTSRITFESLGAPVDVDAFSVVAADAPPVIVTQPSSLSSIIGGGATFVVGATGTLPLHYQWLFNNQSLAEGTNKLLVLTSLNTNQAGDYKVVITNNFGAVTSSIANLAIDAPALATILSQPFGDTVPVGGYFNLSVVATGVPPLTYRWYLYDQAIDGATNHNLMLTNVQMADAGSYSVVVQNQSSSVSSLPAVLIVSSNEIGGGLIAFQNRIYDPTNASAPVFDIDDFTPLSGSNFVAQLYAGPSLALLRPVGQPTAFQSGFEAGYFYPQTITLANVPPGSNAVAQVRVWDAQFGSSYEEARVMGGKSGQSAILQTIVGGGEMPPQRLQGLESFSLQTGLPYFQTAIIQFVQRQPDNTIVWQLQGQAGSLYSIEKSAFSQGRNWQPYTVVTNLTGTVTFTDKANSGSEAVFYRARILN